MFQHTTGLAAPPLSGLALQLGDEGRQRLRVGPVLQQAAADRQRLLVHLDPQQPGKLPDLYAPPSASRHSSKGEPLGAMTD